MTGQINLVQDERHVKVFYNDTFLAWIRRDYQGVISEVVLYDKAPSPVQDEILRVVVVHAHQFIQRLSADQIMKMGREDLLRELARLDINVTMAKYLDWKEALTAAVDATRISGLTYTVVPRRMIVDDEVTLEFRLPKPKVGFFSVDKSGAKHHFTFWNSASKPTAQYESLHIIPGYHPAMGGRKEIGLVNGHTDYYIRGKAVRCIFCPEEAQADIGKAPRTTSWTHVNHPWFVVGYTVQLKINTTQLLADAGVQELVGVLRASVGVDNQYIGISGGFRPPLEYAHNRLLRLKRPSPWPQADTRRGGNLARGSEAHCVWTHRVLTQEGKLEGAYIPAWFKTEGWLGIYEGAEVRHGIY